MVHLLAGRKLYLSFILNFILQVDCNQIYNFWPRDGESIAQVMRHGVDVILPSSWEPQEEGMMSTVANFPSVRNQGLSNPRKSQTPEGDAC
jgi:hypothetical protein